MKILIIRNYPNYMDVKKATYNIQEIGLACSLTRKGHQCDIVFWTDKKEEMILYKIDGTDLYIKIYYKKAKTILKNAIYSIDDLIAQYDIIQPCEYNQLQSHIYARKYPSKTVVYHGQYYGEENKRYNQWCKFFDLWGLWAYKKNKTLFMTKNQLANDYLVKKGIDKNCVYTVGVGINRAAFNEDIIDAKPQCISDIEMMTGCMKLLYIGEYMPRRHVKFIGQIVKRLNDTGINAVLITVGKTKCRYGEECNKYFCENGISKYIYHIEKMEQKYLTQVYSLCDYFLFPSTYEIFGMVLLEAMYFGLTVLSSENGGSSMIIRGNYNGYILKELNLESWVKKIVEVNIDKNTKQMIGENAKRSVLNEYTWDALCDKFVEVYDVRLGEEKPL